MSEESKEAGLTVAVKKPKPRVEIVLNGGKDELDSATVPIRWWFSEEAIEKEPEYLIFYEQNVKEIENDSYYSGTRGRRYVCKVSDGVKFLQILSPGHHRLMVVAVGGEDAERAIKRYMNKDGKYSFQNSMDFEKAESNRDFLQGSEFIASTVLEFEVPAELFAKKPETRFSKAVWKWAHFFIKDVPVDECHYRKQLIFAFTIQPFLALLMYAAGAMAGSLYASYVLLASLAVLFIGYRPRPIFSEMWSALLLRREKEWEVRRYKYRQYWLRPEQLTAKSIYRLWSYKENMGLTGSKWYTYRYIPLPLTPVFLALTAGFVFLMVNSASRLNSVTSFSWSNFFLSFFLYFVIPVAVVWFIAWYMLLPGNKVKRQEAKWEKNRHREERVRERKVEFAKAEKIRAQRRQKWLSDNFGVSKRVDKVVLSEVPTPPNFPGKIVQRFYVGFWAAKARVCKPFAE